jgi:cyclopropane-fatty-acyl-phospholipid synthase
MGSGHAPVPSLDGGAPPFTRTQAYAIETQGGSRVTRGTGTPSFVVRVPDQETWNRLISGSTYGLAKAFVDGAFDVDGDLVAAARWVHEHHAPDRGIWMARLLLRLGIESWFQTRNRARRNIEFHYDRSNAFYQQFLDRQMLYSAGYFSRPSMSLADAQVAKLDQVARTLDLKEHERFLDVGCGWGALLLHAAERYGVQALGCTVSGEQYAFVARRIAARGLDVRVRVANCDYRSVEGRFDKIASIGMYEHVGRHRLEEYFSTLGRRLAPHGLMLNSGIARPATVRDDDTTLFVRRFVFPGGELPYLSEIVAAAERAGLEVMRIENLRRHYALTCAAWVMRLQAHRERCLALADARTYRTWLLYLAAAAASFDRGDLELYHVLFVHRGEMDPAGPVTTSAAGSARAGSPPPGGS